MSLLFLLLISPLSDIYAYLALLLGVVAEGETAIFIAAFASQGGYLNIYGVFAITFSATLASDWIWFFMGRINGDLLFKKRPKLMARAKKVDHLLEKYPILILFTYRYMYGLRIVLPLVFGFSSLKFKKFAFFSFLSTAIWAGVMCALGFYFSAFLERNLNEFVKYQEIIILSMIALGVLIFLLFRIRKWYKKKMLST